MNHSIFLIKKGAKWLADLLFPLTDLFFPPICSFCGNSTADVPPFEGICRSCLAKIPFRPKSAARIKCLEEPHIEWQGRDRRPNIEVMVVCNYEGMIRKALVSMKFYEAAYMKHIFGSLASHAIRSQNGIYDGIIPVPLHPDRFRERGYNQAELIAKSVSDRTGIPLLKECLYRQKNTKRQSAMKRVTDRMENVADAFICRHPDKLTGKKILLLDDILTSGETMAAAADAIRKSQEDFIAKLKNFPDDGHAPAACIITGIVLASSRK